MRKLEITAIGEPADVLRLVEFQAPAPGPGQAFVEVQAATINASDFLYITHTAREPPPRTVAGGGDAVLVGCLLALVRPVTSPLRRSRRSARNTSATGSNTKPVGASKNLRGPRAATAASRSMPAR